MAYPAAGDPNSLTEALLIGPLASLSVRAKHILSHILIPDLPAFLALSPEQLWKQRNCGKTTANEVAALQVKLRRQLLSASSYAPSSSSGCQMLASPIIGTGFPFDDVPTEVFCAITDKLSYRAVNILKDMYVSTFKAFMSLNEDELIKRRNCGRKTACMILALQKSIADDIARQIREGGDFDPNALLEAPCLFGVQDTDSAEAPDFLVDLEHPALWLSKWVDSLAPNEKYAVVFMMRMGMRGEPPVTLEAIAKKNGLTRERVRQQQSAVQRKAETTYQQRRLRPLADAAAATVAATGGWVRVDDLTTALLCKGRFGELLKHATGFIEFLSGLRIWRDVGLLPSSNGYISILNRSDDSNQASVSFSRERRAADPAVAQQMVKRPVQKILSVLRYSKRALSITEWVAACQQSHPSEGFSANNIRRAMNYPEVVNYDRGKYIWHEYVSIAAPLVQRFEDAILKHFQKFNVDVVSVYKFFENNKVELTASGIPTLTLLYFLLKRNSSGRLVYPEYPKVALPDAEGGAGVFSRVMRDKLFHGRGVTMDELHEFYENVLCADPRLIMAIPDLTRRGALYYLNSSSNSDAVTVIPVPHVRNLDAADMKDAGTTSKGRSRITAVLEERFRYGFRLDSEIDAIRFQEYYKKKYGCASSLTGTELRDLIGGIGVRHASKVFILSAEAKRRLGELVQNAFACGARSVFFTAFFERHDETLATFYIHSAAMLRDCLISLHPNLHFEHDYFAQDDADRPEDEVARCFDEGQAVYTHAQLAKILPYMPAMIIKRLLYRSHSVVSLSTSSRYAHINQVNITEDDRRKAADFIEERLRTSDYVSLLDLDVTQIQARNPEFSEAALRNVLYRLCCDGEYRRDGNIINKKGVAFNALDILRQYCRERDEVTLSELVAEELKITKKAHGAGLMAASQVMVRKDRETFIADRYVVFDTGRTDDILGRFCPCEYIPLQAVVDFSLFPYPGYSWNRFLLESFARRFSQTFRVEGIAVNSLSAGVIVRKSATFTDYQQILADAVAKADIPLENNNVVGFLWEKGYLCRKLFGGTESVIAEAVLRRGRGF